MVGKKILQYEITEKLGEGGMGVVYKALDTKLQRPVALKFLHPSIVEDKSKQDRLAIEARAAAAINHPNICTIYEINEYEDQTFIAMEYVEGSTLRDRVLSGRIETGDALRWARQIASGLAKAHEQGLIHRDIKSANIMINAAGKAVIMDFGLARRTGQARAGEKFSSGGTSAYMSPEQARGDAVDERTDIWSIGVVLYEMLAGIVPFRGGYEQAVMYSILNEPHAPLSDHRSGLNASIERIVDTCLAKDPTQRFQELGALTDSLQHSLNELTGCIPQPGRPRALGVSVLAILVLAAAFTLFDFFRGRTADSGVRVPIAVVDFNNETGENALDGLSGMLITALEQSRRLSVMTRSRMFDVMKTIGRDDVERITESAGQAICRAEGVTALVIPTIRKFGDLYTLDLKVLDTRDNHYLFTTKSEGRGQESIPGLIDDIARKIRIDLREAPEEVDSAPDIGNVTTVNLAAYEAYFDGEELLGHLEFADAGDAFERAIELDSTFALAYYRLGYVRWWHGRRDAAKEHNGYALENIDRIPEKEQYLVRALDAGLTDGFDAQVPIYREMLVRYPNDKEVLFGLGDAEFHGGVVDSSETHLRLVLEIDPGFDRALQHLTWLYFRTGRAALALDVAQKWMNVTGAAEAATTLAQAHILNDDPGRAVSILTAAYEEDPESRWLMNGLAGAQLAAGNGDHALSMLVGIADTTSNERVMFTVQAVRVGTLNFLGRLRDALQLCDDGITMMSATESPDSSKIVQIQLTKALLHHRLGERDQSADIVDAVREYPEGSRDDHYWRAMVMYCFATGDTTDIDVVLRHAFGRNQPPQAKKFLDIFSLSVAGECAAVSKLMDELFETYPLIGAAEVVSVRYAVGRCLFKAGDFQGAIEALSPALDLKLWGLDVQLTRPDMVLLLARAKDEIGDSAEAMDLYGQVLEIWKNADEGLPGRKLAENRFRELASRSSM